MKRPDFVPLSVLLILFLVMMPQAATGGGSSSPGAGSGGSGGGGRGIGPGGAAAIGAGAGVLLNTLIQQNQQNQQNQQIPAGTWSNHSSQPLSPPANVTAQGSVQADDEEIGSDAVVGGNPTEKDVWNALDDTINKVGEHNRLNFEAIKGERDDMGNRGLGPSKDPGLSPDQRVVWAFQRMEASFQKAKKERDTLNLALKAYQQEAKKGAQSNKDILASWARAMNDSNKRLQENLNQAQAASNTAWRIRANQDEDGWINGKFHRNENDLLTKVDRQIKDLRQPFKPAAGQGGSR